MQENYLNAQQLAQALGVSKSGVFSLVRRGQLPKGYKLGHCRRWLLSDVNSWLSSKQSKRGA